MHVANPPVTDVTEESDIEEKVVTLKISDICPDPDQPRKYFDPTALEQLATSFKSSRQVTPIIVRISPPGTPCKYMLVAGERRWRSRQIAGLKTIKGIIRHYPSDKERELEALVENVGREELTDLEIGAKLKQMKERYEYTTQELAKIICKPDGIGWIEQRINLTRLPDEVQKYLSPDQPQDKRLAFSLAVQLAPFIPEKQVEFARKIVEEQMSFKEAGYMLRCASILGDDGLRGKRSRSPSKDLNMVTNAIDRIGRDAELFLKMGGTMFNRSFSTQTKKERKEFLARMDKTIEDLKMIVEEVKDLPCNGVKA